MALSRSSLNLPAYDVYMPFVGCISWADTDLHESSANRCPGLDTPDHALQYHNGESDCNRLNSLDLEG